MAKLLFESVYWHGLLPGRELPGISAAMPTAGKQPSAGREE
jgi:sulfide:quinone oxidoreductase